MHSRQPSGGPQRGEGQAGQISEAATGRHGQREGGQDSGSQRSGQAGSAVQGRGAGLKESGKSRYSWHGAQGIGEGQEGLQGKGQGKAGHQGADSKGQEKAGRAGKGQRKAGGCGYLGSLVFPGKGLAWWGGVVPPAIPPFLPPSYPAVGTVYPAPPAYPAVPTPASVRHHLQASRTAWGAKGGKGEEHRRVWERIGEEERRLREREARIMGGAARVGRGGAGSGGAAESEGESSEKAGDGGEGRAGRRAAQGAGTGERGVGGSPPTTAIQAASVPLEQAREMQEMAWRQIRAEAARPAERDREVAARERRVREEEEAVGQGAHRVLPDPEGDTPSTDMEGRSPSRKRARGEGGDTGQARRRRPRVEERVAGEAEGAPRPASPSPEPTPTDWGSESPLPVQYAPQPARREPATVRGWRAGDVAELVRYVKWVGRTRGGREKQVKKVPTRTGPCCALSTISCHSYGLASHQVLHDLALSCTISHKK